MKKLVVLSVLLLWSYYGESQSTILQNDFEKHRQVGFNVSEMINLFIPFKGRLPSGPFGAIWRSGRNNKYFNLQIGAQITGDNNDFGNIQVGYLRKKPLNDKMLYYTSTNIILSGGGLNLPSIENDNDGRWGLSFGGGFEYALAKNVSVATEAFFMVLLGGINSGIQIVPPLGIYLLGRF